MRAWPSRRAGAAGDRGDKSHSEYWKPVRLESLRSEFPVAF